MTVYRKVILLLLAVVSSGKLKYEKFSIATSRKKNERNQLSWALSRNIYKEMVVGSVK